MESVDSFLQRQVEKTGKCLSINPDFLSKKEFEDWKGKLADTLFTILGLDSAYSVNEISTDRIESVHGIKTEKMVYSFNRELDVPCYILSPEKQKDNKGIIIALHGHGYGAKDIIGQVAENTYQHRFALALAESGYKVYAPEMLGFGELRLKEDIDSGNAKQNSCHRLSMNLLFCGKTLLGYRIEQVMALIKLIKQKEPEGKIGIMGISGGATVAAFISAMDRSEDIEAVVISGYANLFRTSILDMRHCQCNYVPSLYKYVEMDDILSAICPKPMLWESGDKDPIYPQSAAKLAELKVLSCYKKFGDRASFQTDYFSGVHEISMASSVPFFDTFLSGFGHSSN